jgi:hypothetical protein
VLPQRERALWEEHDVVFARENGRPLDPQADLREWSAILAKAGIAHAGTHTMRHSAAVIVLDEGIALAVVQEMLGHSDIRVTRGYTHVSSLLAQDAAARVGRALFGETATKTDRLLRRSFQATPLPSIVEAKPTPSVWLSWVLFGSILMVHAALTAHGCRNSTIGLPP